MSARRLRTYSGTHTQVGASVPVPLGTPNVTQSGDTLVAELNNVVLAGTGLTGSVTVVPGSQLGSSGEAVLITVRPDGRESFLAVDNCECSFGGQTGTVTIRAYGTVTSNGLTRGTFLVTSGGARQRRIVNIGRLRNVLQLWPARRDPAPGRASRHHRQRRLGGSDAEGPPWPAGLGRGGARSTHIEVTHGRSLLAGIPAGE